MKFNLKYILIALVVIIIVLSIMAFSPMQDDTVKKNEVDNLFAIWANISGPGDQQTLAKNEQAIKKDLYDKLDINEITSLKNYSASIQNFLSVKTKPFDPLFLNSLSYLTQNFNTAKATIGKTNAKNIFESFGLGAILK